MIVTLDRNADRPLYKQLADELRDQIERGNLAPGQELPAQTALATEYDLGRDAVQDALALLRSEGLIVTERGKPAYVAEPAQTTVTLAQGDQVEVRGGTVIVTRSGGTSETYQSGTVRIVGHPPRKPR